MNVSMRSNNEMVIYIMQTRRAVHSSQSVPMPEQRLAETRRKTSTSNSHFPHPIKKTQIFDMEEVTPHRRLCVTVTETVTKCITTQINKCATPKQNTNMRKEQKLVLGFVATLAGVVGASTHLQSIS